MCTTEEFTTHRQNYRMAYDAMRAYHSSEIEHKKDMILILNVVLGAFGSASAGISVYIFSWKGNLIFSAIGLVILLIFTPLFIRSLLKKNIEKIRSDNDRYEKFREECLLERDFLKLTEYFDGPAIKNSRHKIYWDIEKKNDADREGTGYLKTIEIINSYANMLMLFFVIFQFLLFLYCIFWILGPIYCPCNH